MNHEWVQVVSQKEDSMYRFFYHKLPVRVNFGKTSLQKPNVYDSYQTND